MNDGPPELEDGEIYYIARLMRIPNRAKLDRIVRDHKLAPLKNKDGVRIGNVLRVWRDGYWLMGLLEVVPEDACC